MKTKIKLIYFKGAGTYYSDGEYISKKEYYHEIVQEISIMQRERTLPGLVDGALYDCVMLPEEGSFAIPYFFNSNDFR